MARILAPRRQSAYRPLPIADASLISADLCSTGGPASIPVSATLSGNDPGGAAITSRPRRWRPTYARRTQLEHAHAGPPPTSRGRRRVIDEHAAPVASGASCQRSLPLLRSWRGRQAAAFGSLLRAPSPSPELAQQRRGADTATSYRVSWCRPRSLGGTSRMTPGRGSVLPSGTENPARGSRQNTPGSGVATLEPPTRSCYEPCSPGVKLQHSECPAGEKFRASN